MRARRLSLDRPAVGWMVGFIACCCSPGVARTARSASQSASTKSTRRSGPCCKHLRRRWSELSRNGWRSCTTTNRRSAVAQRSCSRRRRRSFHATSAVSSSRRSWYRLSGVLASTPLWVRLGPRMMSSVGASRSSCRREPPSAVRLPTNAWILCARFRRRQTSRW